MTKSQNANGIALPPPPREPDLDECCGTGCDPCIFDIYEERLERWRRRCDAIRQRCGDDAGTGGQV
jgi:cytochrome-b5 reductase